MNTEWLRQTKERKIAILNQVSNATGLSPNAVEKDWWVTLTLFCCFNQEYSEHIVFKGGTSLSKGWNLIERFSEDIDLAIDRKFFGFDGDISKSQINKLRKNSCAFITKVFVSDLKNHFTNQKAMDECEVKAKETKESDRDPQVIEIDYDSAIEKSEYLPSRVLVEVSSRSLIEPTEDREINSLIGETYKDQSFSTKSFKIPTVLPQRTFLEKILLLHEIFSLEDIKQKSERLSRHLYDLEKLMDTEFGKTALKDDNLFVQIVNHRKIFNAIRGLDYSNHVKGRIRIVPPDKVIKEWEKDYNLMRGNMIYGKSLDFSDLLKRIKELQDKVNETGSK
ncbi:nucleotidyl transferase AbiEii/AbiGii toxin family protein [Ignavibacterium sp.]|uniref:nucleotidyl transferase AbiEii/AbiGii toxin family protein n=1 Tax=Ignavibacterium sp. TaxID=2651167 RepID=UPI00307E8B69